MNAVAKEQSDSGTEFEIPSYKKLCSSISLSIYYLYPFSSVVNNVLFKIAFRYKLLKENK